MIIVGEYEVSGVCRRLYICKWRPREICRVLFWNSLILSGRRRRPPRCASAISQKIQTFNLPSRMRNNKILFSRGMRAFRRSSTLYFVITKIRDARIARTSFAVVTENYFCACKLTELLAPTGLKYWLVIFLLLRVASSRATFNMTQTNHFINYIY